MYRPEVCVGNGSSSGTKMNTVQFGNGKETELLHGNENKNLKTNSRTSLHCVVLV